MKHRSTRLAAVSLGLALSLSGSVLAATAANAAPAPTIVAATAYSDPFTKKVHDLMNAERAKVGARPLVYNQKIADVSQDWANKLGVATLDPNFDWANIHRPDAGGSLIPAGYFMYRENVGFNFTPEQIVQWWMNSPGHKAAMLHPQLTDGGLGYVVPTSGPYKGWHLVVSNMAGYNSTPVPSSPSPAPLPSTQSPLAVKAATYNGALGTPGPEVYGLKNGGSYQCFSVGCILHSPATGARLTMGAIRDRWATTGFENGRLGYPVTDEVAGLKGGGVYQNYQGGSILWSPASGAHVSEGAIRTTWAATGYESGSLGYPTSDEYKVEGGVAQNYQGGVITHNYSSGNRIVSSEMAARYKEHSAYLGTAVADKVAIRDGGFYQNFVRGSILWSPATGAQISIGGIRSIWASVGYENGVLGYPTSGELSAGGGVYQNYQHGVITWHGTGGGHFVFGGIGSMYKGAGGATGRLGLATSGEYLTGGGNVAQNFQGGTIHWGPNGTRISYK